MLFVPKQMCFSISFDTKKRKVDRMKQGGNGRIGDLDSLGESL